MKTQNHPRILIVGGGAIGGFYGGKLAQGGARVSVVCRSNFEAVKSRGYTIKSHWGDFRFIPEHVLSTMKDYRESPDFVIVTMKALPELHIPELIKISVKKMTSIVLLQNGIDLEPEYLQAFPDTEIISGLAFVCVSQKEPGCIYHQDFGRVCIGRYPNGKSGKSLELGQIFNLGGVPCTISDEIIRERWKKLIWNAPFNSLSVLGGGKNTQEIMQNPNATSLVKDIMQEVMHVAGSTGHNISQEVARKHLADTQSMKPYKTSMLLDFEAGKKLEFEAILGNLLKIAEIKKVSVPCSRSVYRLLKLLSSQ